MLTGHKRHQVDQIWDAIHAGGIANPIQVIEQLTYLLFLKRLDENQLKTEADAQLLGGSVEKPTFSAENRHLRWHVLKQRDPADIFNTIRDAAFPSIKGLGGENSTLSRHMENAIFLWPNAALLARVVEMLDGIEMNDADTKGDLYEYMLAKLSQGGQNGQFRTPRHIIAAMVEMTAPQPSDILCDPACGTLTETLRVAVTVSDALRQILRQSTQLNSAPDFGSITAYENGQQGFNDHLIARLCQDNDLALLTNDADFAAFDLKIITALPALLQKNQNAASN